MSLRAYPHFDDIRRMVSRSAYAQLRYSPLLLIATVFGMAFDDIVRGARFTRYSPPFLPTLLAASAWALMAIAFLPIFAFIALRRFGRLALPVIAAA